MLFSNIHQHYAEVCCFKSKLLKASNLKTSKDKSYFFPYCCTHILKPFLHLDLFLLLKSEVQTRLGAWCLYSQDWGGRGKKTTVSLRVVWAAEWGLAKQTNKQETQPIQINGLTETINTSKSEKATKYLSWLCVLNSVFRTIVQSLELKFIIVSKAQIKNLSK